MLLDLFDDQFRRITLPAKLWREKILVTHPEVEPYLEREISLAVTNPSFVNVDKLFTNRRCHYLELPRNRSGKRRFLKVVIDYNVDEAGDIAEGKIISVYRASGVPAQELRIWP